MKLILGFSTDIEISKLGFKYFEVRFDLKNYYNKNNIIDYIKNNKYLPHIDVTIGGKDLQFEFHLKNLDHLLEIINDLTSKYPDDIIDYNFYYHSNVEKIHYFFNIKDRFNI